MAKTPLKMRGGYRRVADEDQSPLSRKAICSNCGEEHFIFASFWLGKDAMVCPKLNQFVDFERTT